MKQRLRDLEARDNWIEARADELTDDAEFEGHWVEYGGASFLDYAKQQATREHANIIADLEEAIIDSMELKA